MKEVKKMYECVKKKITRVIDYHPNRRICIRVREEEYEAIKKRADRHAGGNVTLYMVYSALFIDPK